MRSPLVRSALVSVTVASPFASFASFAGCTSLPTLPVGVEAPDSSTRSMTDGATVDGPNREAGRNAPTDADAPESGLADAPSCPDAGDSGLEPPSCASGGSGMTHCGPGGGGCESCCASLEVRGRNLLSDLRELGQRPDGRGGSRHRMQLSLGQVLGDGGAFPSVRCGMGQGRRATPHASGGVGCTHAPEWGTGAREQRRPRDLRTGMERDLEQHDGHRPDEW